MKLNDALDDILGKGMASTIRARSGVVGAVAAGLAAVELGDATKPSARAFATWADGRLRDDRPRRHVVALDVDMEVAASVSARSGGTIDRFRAASASDRIGSVASS